MSWLTDLIGGGGSSPQVTYQTQTTSENLPEWQATHLKKVANQAQSLYDAGGPQYYPDSTVVGFSPETEQALQNTQNLASQGSQVNQQAINTGLDFLGSTGVGLNALQQSANGQMLNSNPYLNNMMQQAMDPVRASVNSQFAASGRYGSGANQDVLADSLADATSRIGYQNYETERRNQLNSANQLGAYGQNTMGQAGQLDALRYADSQRLAGVGAARESQAQAQLADDVARFNFNNAQPWQQLGLYQSAVSGGMGGTTSTVSPIYSNPGANFLGGAAAGAGVGNMIGGSTGALVGALGGGLLGGGIF